MTLGLRLYRAALRLLLPRPFVDKHGEAMEELCRRELERARRERGRWAVAPATCAAVWDVMRRAARERRRGKGNDRGPGRQRMDEVRQDLAFAVRSLLRAPRFAVVAVLTLALGIGANTAVFSVVDAVMLRPLPFPEPDRVVHLAWAREGYTSAYMPHYKVEYWREHGRVFEAVSTYQQTFPRLGEDPRGARASGLAVDEDFFAAAGLEPVVGRTLDPAEQHPDASSVVLVSHELWLERWGGDPAAIGASLRLDGRGHTVVGVLPPDFEFPYASRPVQLVVPLAREADPLDEGENWSVLARLRPGVGAGEAQADLDRVWALFRAEHPGLVNGTDLGMRVASFQDLYADDVARPLWVLLGAIGLVLLIACANVASLLLARASDRRREIAVRAALGASRGRVVRQLLTESAVLAALGGALGLALASLGVEALLALNPEPLPRAAEIGLDGRVLAFTLIASGVTGLLFGLAAALPASRGVLSGALAEGGRAGSVRTLGRGTLLAVEAALSMVLLVGAGLLVMTIFELRSVDAGFDPDDVVVFALPTPPDELGAPGALRALEDRVLTELEASPAVEAAAWVSSLPLERGLNIPVAPFGRPDDVIGGTEWRAVSPGYLDALDVSLLQGRALTPADDAGAAPVALVNEALARRFFPDGALGEEVEIGKYRGRPVIPGMDLPPARIVGVVADQRDITLRSEARPTVFVPRSQAPAALSSPGQLVVEASRPVEAVATARAVLARAVPGGDVPSTRTLDQVVTASLARENFHATLLGVFAALALALTAFGIYGVVSYAVRQRHREIGIRMALGARGSHVVRQVAAAGMRPVLLGLVVGGAAALFLTRFMAGLLWGVSPTDPGTVAAVAAILAAVALVASWLPARHATRTDPAGTLRSD